MRHGVRHRTVWVPLSIVLCAACGGESAGPTPTPAPPPPAPPAAPEPAAGWTTLPSAPVHDIRHDDLTFLDTQTGWLANMSGEVYKTDDGGDTWTQLFSDAAIHARSIGFANEQHGWLGNLNGFTTPDPMVSLFETQDGGNTWTNITDRVSGPEPVGICGIWVVDEDVVNAVGRWHGPAVFVRTEDGGQTWSSRDLSPLATGLVGIFFFDDQVGLISGGRGVGSSPEEQESSLTIVLRTEDGGQTWEEAYVSDRPGTWGWKFSFPTSQTGHMAEQGPAQDGVVLKTTDGGRTWSEL